MQKHKTQLRVRHYELDTFFQWLNLVGWVAVGAMPMCLPSAKPNNMKATQFVSYQV